MISEQQATAARLVDDPRKLLGPIGSFDKHVAWRDEVLEFLRTLAAQPDDAAAAADNGKEILTMTEAQIKHMVNRFLAWKLPENFSPDAGISFKKTFNDHTDHPMKHDPSGTNLFDATQADAMVRYMIEGLAMTPEQQATAARLADAVELPPGWQESLDVVGLLTKAACGEMNMGCTCGPVISDCPAPQAAMNAVMASYFAIARQIVQDKGGSWPDALHILWCRWRDQQNGTLAAPAYAPTELRQGKQPDDAAAVQIAFAETNMDADPSFEDWPELRDFCKWVLEQRRAHLALIAEVDHMISAGIAFEKVGETDRKLREAAEAKGCCEICGHAECTCLDEEDMDMLAGGPVAAGWGKP